jgi:hypothetical protein
VADTLAVHLNRDGPHSVESQREFETDGPFTVELRNHGTPSHVHLRLDDDLAAVATLDDANYYVEDHTAVEVAVPEDHSAAVSGRVEVVTGYGAESTAVPVTLLPAGSLGVAVEESLSTPAERDPGPPDDRTRTLAVGGLAVVAVLLSAVLLVAVEGTAALALGALALLLAVGGAAALLQSS